MIFGFGLLNQETEKREVTEKLYCIRIDKDKFFISKYKNRITTTSSYDNPCIPVKTFKTKKEAERYIKKHQERFNKCYSVEIYEIDKKGGK